MQIKGLRGKLLRGGLYSNPLMYVNRNQTQGHRSHRVWTKMSFPSLSHLLPEPGTLAGIIGLENQGTYTQKHKKYSKLSLVGKLQKEGDNKKKKQTGRIPNRPEGSWPDGNEPQGLLCFTGRSSGCETLRNKAKLNYFNQRPASKGTLHYCKTRRPRFRLLLINVPI